MSKLQKRDNYYYIDHSGLIGHELLESLKQANREGMKLIGNDNLAIIDFTNCIYNNDVSVYLLSREAKEGGKKFKKICALGVVGFKKVMGITYDMTIGNNNVVYCYSLNEAIRELQK